MFQAGVPPRYMRICEPFGPEQRQGLWLYHVVEPERWAAMCERVSGVHSGGSTQGRTITFMATVKFLNLTRSAGASMPCCCSTVCRKPRRNITAIKSRFICAGIRSEAWPIFPTPRRAISGRRIFRHGDACARYYSTMTTGVAPFHSVLTNQSTISVTVNG